MITKISLVKILTLRLLVPTMTIYLITIQIIKTMTPLIFLIIVTTIIGLVAILIIVIHLIITQIFLPMIPIRSTVAIIVTRIRITIIRNRIVFLQIIIKGILIAELNIKLRNVKIILIRIMIVIIIILITVVIKITTTTTTTIIIIVHLTMKITQDTRNTVFIPGDSIVQNVNNYLLKKRLRNKKPIKVRSFSGAKVSCMYDHAKPTIREFNPNHIILHVGTNELKSSKTASQISRSVIDLALSLKSETNAVTISLIVPRKDNLNNKAQEVNSRLINMCGERDIAFIDHTDTIDTERHLNESKVHLNKSGTIEFAKNVFEFLLQQD